MAESIFERTIVKIQSVNNTEFKATGEVLIFDGFLKLYNEIDDSSKLLPKLEEKNQFSKQLTFSPKRFSLSIRQGTLKQV